VPLPCPTPSALIYHAYSNGSSTLGGGD
jgi:hypothetical protein